MPKSVASYYSLATSRGGTDDDRDHEESAELRRNRTAPSSPTDSRRNGSSRTSDLDLRSRLPSRLLVDENASLLGNADGRMSGYRTVPGTPKQRFSRQNSFANTQRKNISRRASIGQIGQKLARALGAEASPTEGM